MDSTSHGRGPTTGTHTAPLSTSDAARFHNLSDWQQNAGNTLRLPGPRFISLKVQPTPPEYLSHPTPPLADQLDRLRQALAH